jgi:CubicO group peptidase (beta-lactamase class C family)
LLGDLTGQFAFVGLALQRGNDPPVIMAQAAPGIAADARSIFRVASVSKVITGAMVSDTLTHNDISRFLAMPQGRRDWLLRHPDYPDVPITGGMLASHSAGLTDDAGYAVPEGDALIDWLTDLGRAVWSDHKPGTHFSYSNLGYVVLGTALETTQRFDKMASGLLDNIGMTGGFNWSGVSADDRRRRLATYRRAEDQFVAMIDAEIAPAGVTDPDGKARDLRRYRPGQNAGLFAPQGGLRTDLQGMLRLAQTCKDTHYPVLWSPEMGTMDNDDGLFDQYSIGVQILRNPAFYPRPLVGHFGNAYGFNGGVWYDAQADMAFAYALNGVPMGDESDAMSDAERSIFAAVAALEG